LADGDTVPVLGYRRIHDILKDLRTREYPTVTRPELPLFTPGQEQRAGIRDWLR
jgi:hypothetical protein